VTDERWLMITPKQVGVQADQTNRSVVMGLDVSDPQLGLAPGLSVGLRMSPTEARQIAEVLLRKADEAEVGLPRA
jgi:hypothetical protein